MWLDEVDGPRHWHRHTLHALVVTDTVDLFLYTLHAQDESTKTLQFPLTIFSVVPMATTKS